MPLEKQRVPPGAPRHSRANVIADPRLSSAERHRDLDIAITPSLHPCPRTRPRATTNLDDLFFLTSRSTISTTTSGSALSTRSGYRQSRDLDSHVAPDREQHDTNHTYTPRTISFPIPASAELALHIGPAQLAPHRCTSRYGARHTACRHRYKKHGHHMSL